jgi:glyoxylase-like metal-dependent hydrolase (beta-lactamase superfamily II)
MKISNQPDPLICSTCGTWYSQLVPEVCPVCSDGRQYVPEEGQLWTKPVDLHANHKIQLKALQENLTELIIHPHFAIGQRALLVASPAGNVLWDCIPLLDEATISFISSKGGLKAIAISHPHYYSNMNAWAKTFDCPIYIHEKDEAFISDKGPHVKLWSGSEKQLLEGIRIVHIGGHFPGSCILHVAFLSEGGSVLSGDTVYLSLSKKHLAIMYSYPNRIPLPQAELKQVKQRLQSISFDRLYGFFSYQNLLENVQSILQDSFKRYEV